MLDISINEGAIGVCVCDAVLRTTLVSMDLSWKASSPTRCHATRDSLYSQGFFTQWVL